MIRSYLRPSGLHRHVATMSSILSLMEMAEVESAIGAENCRARGSWTTVQDNIAEADGLVQITDVGAAAQTKLFYRLILL